MVVVDNPLSSSSVVVTALLPPEVLKANEETGILATVPLLNRVFKLF